MLRDHLAPLIAKALAKVVFQVPVISDSLIDFLTERFKSNDEAKQAEQQIDRLVEQCLAPLMPMFGSAKGFEPEAVAALLGKTVQQQADLSALIKGDLNRVSLHQKVLEAEPLDKLRDQAYGDANIAAYQQALPLLLNQMIDLAPKLDGFEEASTAETLGRLTKLAQDAEAIRMGIETLQMRFDDIVRFRNEEEQTYAIDYCTHIDEHLNAVQLFGITSETVASQQKLSTAFIPLSLARDSADQRQTGSIYFDSLLERLTPETPRLLITGPAGSGKTTLLKWAAIQAAEMIKIGVEKTIQWDLEDRLGATIKALTDVMVRAPKTAKRMGLAEEPAIAFRHAADKMGEYGPDGEWHQPEPAPIEDSWWLRVPFFIPLRYCEGGRLPDLQVYPKIGTEFPFDPPEGWVQAILQAGRALILIDGIDEIPESDRSQIKRTLEGFCRLDKGNYVIFSTRPTAIDDRWFQGIPMMQADVNPLMDRERAELINRWHQAAAEQLALIKRPDDVSTLAPVLVEKLEAAPHIAQLGTNPLLCAAICALHYSRRGYLPKDQADLCQQLCELLIHRRDEERDLLRDGRERDYGKLDYKQKEALLRDLAQTNLRTGGATLDGKAAEERIRNKLPALKLADLDPADIKRGLIKRTGMLREAYGGAIDFSHNTLRDFLSGKAFADEPGGHQELLNNVDKEAWHRPIVFAAGKGARPFAEALVHDLVDSPDRSANILAMLAENAATELDPDLSAKVDAFYGELLPPTTVEEGRQLAALGDLVVDQLVHPDADEPTAHACAQALRLIGTAKARKALRAYWDTGYEEVAEELARVFHPLTVPFWQDWVQRGSLPEAWAHQVSDISALSGALHAKRLYLEDTGLNRLEPLSGLSSLEELDLGRTRVSNLEPLRGLTRLKRLDLNDTGVRHLDALSDLTSLERLDLGRTDVTCIGPLSNLSTLRELYLRNSNIDNIEALSSLINLQRLDLKGTRVNCVEPLRGLNSLQYLDLSHTMIDDLTALSRLFNLQGLILSSTKVTDLEPLRGLSALKLLTLGDDWCGDLEPLSGLTNLRQLNLGYYDLNFDISPLDNIKDLQILHSLRII